MKPDLQATKAYWQSELRLLDWRIVIEYVRDLCAPDGSPVYGLCDHTVDNKTAYIQVRDPETPINDGRPPGEIVEETVIHELSHLHFAALGLRRPAEVAAEENAVWAFSEALARAKGTPREAMLARAMKARISALAERRRMGGKMLTAETIKAALEALKSGDGNQASEVLTQILAEATAGAMGGDPPPPPAEMGGGAPPPGEEKKPPPPAQRPSLAARPPIGRPVTLSIRPPQGADALDENALRAMVGNLVGNLVSEGVKSGLDASRRDELLEREGHVLPEDDLRFAKTAPFEVVRRMVALAGGNVQAQGGGERGQPRVQRRSTPTRGAQGGGVVLGAVEDPTGGIIDRLMGVRKDEQPAVMLDPQNNRLMISNLRPMTAGVVGQKAGK